MKYAIITGKGEFPFDMLRYDACYPNSEQDSALIASGQRLWLAAGGSKSWSVCVRSASDNKWTVGRWESFGVKIVEVPREMTFERQINENASPTV